MTNNSPHLILTVDYELFGDGSGCIEHCITLPAERILDIANKHDAKVTLFTDAIEFIRMEQELKHSNSVEQVKRQLFDSVDNGHDVQLHVHPQWVGARFLDDQWHVNFNAWRIADMDQGEIHTLFENSIEWIEKNVSSNDYIHKCIVFRAGGWCVQPSDKIIKALQMLDLTIDSTVAPGMYNSQKGEWCDFRHTPSLPYWHVERDVCTESGSGIVELPIATGHISKVRHLKAIRTARKAGMAPGCVGSYQGPDGKFQSIMGKLSKLRNLGHVMLDFSTMPSDVLIAITEQWIERHRGYRGSLPIVAIAHTKNFTADSAKNFEEYLRWATEKQFQFSTYRRWYEVMHG